MFCVLNGAIFFELEIRIPVGEEGTRCGNVALSGAV